MACVNELNPDAARSMKHACTCTHAHAHIYTITSAAESKQTKVAKIVPYLT